MLYKNDLYGKKKQIHPMCEKHLVLAPHKQQENLRTELHSDTFIACCLFIFNNNHSKCLSIHDSQPDSSLALTLSWMQEVLSKAVLGGGGVVSICPILVSYPKVPPAISHPLSF